jgi:hypothetical protein
MEGLFSAIIGGCKAKKGGQNRAWIWYNNQYKDNEFVLVITFSTPLFRMVFGDVGDEIE